MADTASRTTTSEDGGLVATPLRGLLFRILHRDNLSWILAKGLHAPSSDVRDPDYTAIGDASIIEKRRQRTIPVPPFGLLEDYVPFYFTPWSIMLFNIVTGYNVPRVAKRDVERGIGSILQGRGEKIPVEIHEDWYF